MPAKISALQHLGFAKESTWGTGVSPTTYIPFDSVKPESTVNTVVDEGKRNNIAKDFAVYPTTRSATLDVETYLYTNELGHILAALMGGVTTTGTGAPYTHTFKPTSGQRSLTFQHYNGESERQYAGCVVDELSVKGDAEGLVTVSFKAQGKYHTATTTTSPTIAATLAAIAGINSTLKIDTVTNANLFGFEFTFKRSNKLIFGANTTQDPTKAVQGVFEVTGKLTFDIVDNAEYAMFDGQAYHAIDLTVGSDAQNKAQFTFSKAFIEKATVDDGQENLRVDWEFRAVYNATDAAQCVVKLFNSTASY